MKAFVVIILQILLQCTGKSVYKKLTVCCIGCVPFSVLWYNFMNKQTCPFFCNNTAILYSFILNKILEECCHCIISLRIGEYHNHVMYSDQLYTFKQKDMMDYNFFILISYLIDIANILKGEILSCSLMRDYSMGSMHKRFFSTTCYASKKWTSECSEQVCFLMHGNKWIKIVQALSTVWYLCVWPSYLVDKYIVYLYYCFFYHLYLPSTLWKFVSSHHEGCLFLKSR